MLIEQTAGLQASIPGKMESALINDFLKTIGNAVQKFKDNISKIIKANEQEMDEAKKLAMIAKLEKIQQDARGLVSRLKNAPPDEQKKLAAAVSALITEVQQIGARLGGGLGGASESEISIGLDNLTREFETVADKKKDDWDASLF